MYPSQHSASKRQTIAMDVKGVVQLNLRKNNKGEATSDGDEVKPHSKQIKMPDNMSTVFPRWSLAKF